MFLVYGATGDAMGFPVEAGVVDKVDGFIDWTNPKTKENIKRGEYSDDTQMTLAIARSIWNGEFHPDYFAYVELPLWVYYKRGAGKATTKAALNMFSPRIQWYSNFYPGYEEAGGSGAAMRISPIVAAFDDLSDIVKYVIYSTIITHGNSNALWGALLAADVMVLAKEKKTVDKTSILETLKIFYEIAKNILTSDDFINEWKKVRSEDFLSEFESTFKTVLAKIENINLNDKYPLICRKSGEYDTPGMGLSVALCVAGLAMKIRKEPAKELLFMAANEKGTDTDTIASILGSVIGFYGEYSELSEMAKSVQDYEYMLRIQQSLLSGEFEERKVDRQEVRKYAMELEKALKASKLPNIPHPVFGKLQIVEERGKFFKVATEEGQTIFMKHQ